jgi:hypothetical protein
MVPPPVNAPDGAGDGAPTVTSVGEFSFVPTHTRHAAADPVLRKDIIKAMNLHSLRTMPAPLVVQTPPVVAFCVYSVISDVVAAMRAL